jgi:hypothetical protein
VLRFLGVGEANMEVGLALSTTLFCSQAPASQASMFHVTNLAPPGSEFKP